MSYNASIYKLLKENITIQNLFPSIALMILPTEQDGNYISFRKISSNCVSTLDNFLSDKASYEISCYAKEFEDLASIEKSIIDLFNGTFIINSIGGGGKASIVQITESEDSNIKKYVMTFSVNIL